MQFTIEIGPTYVGSLVGLKLEALLNFWLHKITQILNSLFRILFYTYLKIVKAYIVWKYI